MGVFFGAYCITGHFMWDKILRLYLKLGINVFCSLIIAEGGCSFFLFYKGHDYKCTSV